MANRIRQRFLVSGTVQGVFFRDSCRREARRLGVAGWVRNTDDDRVEVVAEGDVDQVVALRGWCESGPDQARVERLDATDEDPEGLTGFQVR